MRWQDPRGEGHAVPAYPPAVSNARLRATYAFEWGGKPPPPTELERPYEAPEDGVPTTTPPGTPALPAADIIVGFTDLFTLPNDFLTYTPARNNQGSSAFSNYGNWQPVGSSSSGSATFWNNLSTTTERVRELDGRVQDPGVLVGRSDGSVVGWLPLVSQANVDANKSWQCRLFVRPAGGFRFLLEDILTLSDANVKKALNAIWDNGADDPNFWMVPHLGSTRPSSTSDIYFVSWANRQGGSQSEVTSFSGSKACKVSRTASSLNIEFSSIGITSGTYGQARLGTKKSSYPSNRTMPWIVNTAVVNKYPRS